MLTEEHKEHFDRDGYLHIPGVLTNEEVAFLRAFVRPLFDSRRVFPGIRRTDVDVFRRYPQVR